jgi:aryl-alcohol dehydrogenase-like predicted oxidoreductase
VRYLSVPGISQPVSQLALGSMVFNRAGQTLTDSMLGAWLEGGGNLVDSARIYARGESEAAMGAWLARSGRRDELLILTKGCHHDAERNRVSEPDLRDDLLASLAALQTGWIDLYVLHRDDPAVPVGEIVEWLAEHRAAGRIRAYGGSNWSTERVGAANAYARAHGLPPFAAISNHLSLAVPKEPHYPGTLALDSDDIRWLGSTGIPNFAWSAGANGFFSGHFGPPPVCQEFIRRVYDSECNWERFRCAARLAEQRGLTATQVALAYVLNQPFQSAAIAGPANPDELTACLAATEVSLSPADLTWLEGAGDPASSPDP